MNRRDQARTMQGRGVLLSLGGIALLLLLALPLRAEIVNAAPRPRIGVPHAAAIPKVDADPADPAWNGAASIVSLSPSLREGKDAALPVPASATEIRLLWDAEWLYVRFLCRGGMPYTPERGRNALLYKGDAVEMFIDPAGDARQWIELQANVNNDLFQQLFLCTGEPQSGPTLRLRDDLFGRDVWIFRGWELTGLRNAASRRDGSGAGGETEWIVDLALPAASLLKRLGKTKFEPMTLRAEFLRALWSAPGAEGSRYLVFLDWAPVTYGNPHRSPAAFGFLDLLP
ncbi:hypothetical protein SAMN05444156_0945 [Verrucomicrobium sp. GAS474]|uniref:carbohydrate-binding family 9-like protein n=1 Tax=Verrucomicrobium sp. GAS474 TaxID=1882831 RepID=UPI00087C4095|nr:carbohydrate-binding family 9-like protein [Verrucomicrobium sp. GAS474]SDT94344.1 hypothetical protein SAMN05444156_0945 [Verrucomicrobium sp. GAS474]